MPLFIFFALILHSTSSTGSGDALFHAGAFSSQSTGQLFQQWQPYGFDKVKEKTVYTHLMRQGKWVIKAESNGSASGLARKVDIDPGEFPIVSWRWRITATPSNADDNTRAGDDHAARLYIIFDAPENNLLGQIKQGIGLGNTHAINYIWANDMDIGTFRRNPYSARSIMLAVNSGQEQAGEWITHRRNFAEDYRNIFGKNPPNVSAVAIMTDTDNGQGQVTSYYGDIVFLPAE